jgi:hypothetical protein
MPEQTAAPKAPAAPVANAPATNAPTASAAAALAIDERFAKLAGDFMGQVDAKIEAVRQEFLTQFGQNVDPLHKDLHDLLDLHTQLGNRLEKLEALQPGHAARLDELQKLIESLPEVIAEEVAPKIQPTVQPVITVTDQSIEDRVRRLEGKLKSF